MQVSPPRQLVLETSAACQLRCPQCWVGLRWTARDVQLMSMELFDRIVTEARGFIKHTYLHLWGEPTLNPALPEMVRRTREFSTVDLSTHALFIDEAMAEALAQCDTLSVSIDGLDQETYDLYRRGGQLEEAIRGVRLLLSKRQADKPRINWTFVTFKQNEHQIPQAQAMAEAIGLNFGAKPPVFWDRRSMTASMPSDEKYRRYRLVDGEWELKADRLKCREFWETCYVLPNGDCPTCCYDGDSSQLAGNINRDGGLLGVWNGPAYNAMRQSHEAGVLNKMCQTHCQLP